MNKCWCDEITDYEKKNQQGMCDYCYREYELQRREEIALEVLENGDYL